MTGTDIARRLSLAQICEDRDEALRELALAAEHLQKGNAAAKRAARDHFSIGAEELRRALYRNDTFLVDVTKTLDRAIWYHVLRASELADVMDAKAKREFEQSLKENLAPVNFENLRATLETLIGNAPAILARGVVELFRNLSGEHKTNTGFTIGAKFIISYVVQPEKDGYQFMAHGWGRDHLSDLEKQLSVILGRRPPGYDDNVIRAMERHGLTTEPREIETDLLRVKWHKSGTVHVWIKDPEHVAMVNQIIAQHFGETLGEGHSARQRKPGAEPRPRPVKETSIPADVLDILARGRFEQDRYYLPGQLDRAAYQQVNKVLEDQGIRWNRSAKAHLGPTDAMARLAAAIAGGAYVRSQHKGQFFTPPELARKVIELAEIESGMTVLEPSAGSGALLRALPANLGNVFAVEIDRELAGNLRSFSPVNAIVTEGDFQTLWNRWPMAFDRVVMNPPFANGAGVEHVIAAWNCLKPGGRLVAILPSGWITRQDRKHGFLQELVRQFDGSWTENPTDSFKEAGTSVSTGILVLDKPLDLPAVKVEQRQQKRGQQESLF